MVRAIQIEALDEIPRPVIAIGNEYPPGHWIAPHAHRRSQLLYGASGTIVVGTDRGTWLVPPERAVWIPGGILHEVRMLGAVSTRSLYLEPEAAVGLHVRCEVLGISPFMRALLREAVNVPAAYEPGSREAALMHLILHELRRLPVLPLSLPFPTHPRLAALCRDFVAHPTQDGSIEEWCRTAGLSRRSFTRLFRRETGLPFSQWRQQACLLVAIPRLIAGEPVTAVALDLGYENPASFTTMFKRVLGEPPSRYISDQFP
jgi:AraC-like DNA-binding protein